MTSNAGPWVRLAGEHTDESIDSFELFSARRALKLLKGNLGRERLLELLRDDIAAGDAFLRGHLERSPRSRPDADLTCSSRTGP